MFGILRLLVTFVLSLGIFAHEGNYLKTKSMQSSLPEHEPFTYHVDMI